MNNQEFQQGNKEAYSHQLVSSSSGSISQFTKETLLEEPQNLIALSEDDKLIKNGQLFLAIRKKKTWEEKIRKIDKYLEQGADIAATDKNDNHNTPLHVAVLKCEPEIISALLDRRALIYAKNSNGETPIDIAERLQYQSIIEIFKVRTTPHHISVKEKSISTSQTETRINFKQDNETEKNPQQGVTERSGAQGLHGHIYQLKVLMLFLKRGLDKKYSFRLATENKEHEKFDDLFFEIINKYGEREYRLLQAKHKTNSSEKITFDNLLTLSDSDYSLVKYFFSYHDLKNNFINKGIIRDVTVCTNIDFDLNSTFKDMQIRDIVKTSDIFDDILYFKSNASVTSKRYQFKKEIVPLLKTLVLKYNLTRLAQRLADCIVKHNGIFHHEEPFKAYHIILAEEVIDTENKIFLKKFVNGSELSGEAKRFREIFKETLCVKLPGICFRDINQLIVNSKLCFNLSKEFGDSETNQSWPKNAKDVKELAKNLIDKILKAKIINTKGAFKLYHAVLAKEVIDVKEHKFHDQFVNEEEISENAKKLRNALEIESKLQAELSLKEISKAVNDNVNNKRIGIILSKRFGEEDKNERKNKKNNSKDIITDEEIEYRSQRNIDLNKTNKAVENNLKLINKPVDDNIVKKTWPSDSISDEDINDFLDHLVFAVNQPNEDELGKVIENDIGQDFNFVARDYVYNELFVWMMDWLNGKGKEFISYEDGKSLFDDIKNNLSELELTSVSMEYQYKLKKYDINFKDTFDSKLCNFLKLSYTNIFHVITKEITLSAIKVYKILTSIPEYKHYYNYIFMKLNSVLRQQDRVERALTIPKNVFVITCKTASKDIHEQYNQLFNIMKSSNNENIILISHENDLIDQKFKSDSFFKNKYNEVIDCRIKFSDLSTDSQTKLLETSAVIFQGKKISLNKLITDEVSKDLIEPEVLFMLISNVDVKIGNTSSKLGAMDHYFMYRKLYSCENIEESFKKEFYFTYNGNVETSHLEENQDIVLISDLSMDCDTLHAWDIMDELCSTYEKYNIYWIHKRDEVLTWMYTRYKNCSIRESHSSSQSPKNCKVYIGGCFTNIISTNIELFISKQNLKNRGKEIKDITDNVVILSADPGMGKSSMLAYLAQQLKEFNPFLWVEKIDLKDHTKSLESLKFPINLTEVVDILSGIIDLKTHLEKELFKLRVNNKGKVILLFDGFDEISPKYKEIVLEVLHMLRSSKVERIWVTTRPHLKNEIEDKLSAFSHTLKPLSIEEQRIFLKKFFSQKFNISYTNEKCLGYYSDKVIEVFSKFVNRDIQMALDISNYELPEVREEFNDNIDLCEMHELIKQVKMFNSDSSAKCDPKYILQLIGHKNSPEKRLNDYINKLLESISTSIHDISRLFTGIPLHLRMLVEIFQDNFKDYYDSKQDKINFPEIFDRVNNLHEAFMKEKYESYWKVKNKANLAILGVQEQLETLYLSWKHNLKLLAVSMFWNDPKGIILSEENKNKIDDFKQNIKNERERAGIISITPNGTLNFIHNSFAEYLAVEHICDKLNLFASTANIWSFLDKTIFIKDYENIRRFFEHKLANDQELSSLISQSNSEVFYEKHIYLAVKENLVNCIEILLKIVIRNSNLVIGFKKVFLNAVDVAVFKDHSHIVQVLLKYVKNVDPDGTIEDVSVNYLFDAIRERKKTLVDILLQHIENSDLVVQILNQEYYFQVDKFKYKDKNAIYIAVDSHCLTGDHIILKHIKKLNFDQRFEVLYLFEKSVELTDHRMYFGFTCSPMHRAKQMAERCGTCDKECRQYLDLCSLVSGIWEVHKHLINYNSPTPLEVAKLLSKVIERVWNAKNIIIGVLKMETDTRKKCIINTKMDNDTTIFHLACGSILQRRPANLGMIEFLVAHEADLNIQDSDGRTPLHFAVCAYNALEVVKYLVGKGADFTAVDFFGKTPFLLAYEMNNFEVVQYLLQSTT